MTTGAQVIRAADFSRLDWQLYAENPVLGPPPRSPIMADPSFLPAQDCPDGQMHLFAHALQGIFHYTSGDGVHFKRQGRVVPHAMRPYLFRHGGQYHLVYEKIRRFHLYLGWLPIRWRSQIELRSSDDLFSWSKPTVLLKPTLDWHRDSRYGESVSNPCLLPTNDGFLLFYSANLVHLDDCGFNEPKYFGLARARELHGPYETLSEPIMAPDQSDPLLNMGCGSLKAMPSDNGFVGMMNSIYRDGEGRSRSAILGVASADGVHWERTAREPLIAPSEEYPWMRSHVYAFDFRRDDQAGKWRMYFNARNDWHWSKGSEYIGLAEAAL
ncbi:MAG: glycosyl hydrolase family 43 [Leptospiraceae bacterium]